uniref:procollagen-proline 4-dioxygenase n=1 Tax=Zeugodacus cucurbitae TaxID=28588 RepID=A0A0A1WEX2_ZEUCU
MTSPVQLRVITKRKPKCNGKISRLALLFIALWTVTCHAEYFSSTDSIPMLAIAEGELIQWYREYFEAQAVDFADYRNFIKRVKEEHNLALEDPEAYLSNPINAYKLIKRTVIDWGIITENVRNNTNLQALAANFTTLTAETSLPDVNELRGATKGLGRLQTMYNLSTADLAEGYINDIYYGSELSLNDCFEIGSSLFENMEYPLAKEWLQFVLKLMNDEKENSIRFTNTGNNIDDKESTEDKLISEEIEGSGKENENLSEQNDADEAEAKKSEGEHDDDDDYEYEDNEADSDYYENENENDVDDNLVELDDLIYEPRYGVFAPLQLYELDEYGNLVNESDSKEINNESDHKATLKSSTENYAFNNTNETTHTAYEKDPITEKILLETLEYLALASYELGQQDEMQQYIDEILDINPEHVFKDLSVYMHTKEAERNPTYSDTLTDLQNFEWFANYSRLCQGKQVEQKELHQLKCKLDARNHPLFILAPLQIEELNADPEIVVYHGLLNDKHVEDILEQAEAYMFRSSVGGMNTYKVRDVRVSQQTWLTYHSPTLQYIYRTVSAISGFDLSNAEDMQVANYGIGGQYDPHHDYFADYDPSVKSAWIGNRIATHLFFTSDVEQGGYTVFPLLNVYARPVKGSMVMWRNLHKSLDPDKRTLHAGCPVLKGTKRICNVWVHSGYQEFSHPCDLVRDDYKSAHIE